MSLRHISSCDRLKEEVLLTISHRNFSIPILYRTHLLHSANTATPNQLFYIKFEIVFCTMFIV